MEALELHLNALVIIGAQAVYLHTGATEIALVEFTVDGDVAVDPDLPSSDPLVEEAMSAAGFTPDPRPSAIGLRTGRDVITNLVDDSIDTFLVALGFSNALTSLADKLMSGVTALVVVSVLPVALRRDLDLVAVSSSVPPETVEA